MEMDLRGIGVVQRTRTWPENSEVWKRGIGDVVKRWVKWEGILELYEKCDNSKAIFDARLYFVTLFETGCRCSEAVLLKPNQFEVSDNGIIVYEAIVLKNKKQTSRDIVISKLDNPLADTLEEMVKACKTKYLFPGKTPAGSIREGEHITARTVYNRINEIDGVLFPHCLRAHRAYHLTYERNFKVNDLMAWFGWASANTPIHYTATRDMLFRMGLDKEIFNRLGN
jgi:integrase